MAIESLYSVNEAAKLLGGLSKWTVHTWLSQGRIRRTKVGARTMIRQSDLEAFIANCNHHDGENSGQSTGEDTE